VIHWATRTRQARIGLQLGLSGLVLILLTVPFWVWPIDLWIQSRAWQGEASWSLGEQQPWKILYHLGTLPALVLSVLALIVAGVGSRGGTWEPWTKAGTYLVICMAIGPGLVVNLGLKDHWGRPRPREVSPFGGEYSPETVWIADPSSPGKSFPCGHCTMGFYFFAPGLLLWRFGRRRTAACVLAGAVIGGLLLGIARILQGGHFASDVLWGGGICWLVSLGMFYAMRMDESLTWSVTWPAWMRRGPLQVAGASLLLLLIGGILVATPYRGEDQHELAVASGYELELSLILEGSRHFVSLAAPGETGRILASGRGHGIPGSGVKASWTARREGGGESYFQFKQRISGWLSELDQVNEVRVPNAAGVVRISVQSGAAVIDLGRASAAQSWIIRVAPGARCRWSAGETSGEVIPGEQFELKLPLTEAPAP